jgi:putative transposase
VPYRQNAFAAGNIYHIYNRAITGTLLFALPDNYVYLLRKAKELTLELRIAVLAYCLMPTHYHFVLRQEADAPISLFVQRLFQTYTQAFNKQQNRRGPLLENRFRHVLADRDSYAAQLCRYVHLNAVAAGIVRDPAEWPYSNYLEWIEARNGTLVDRSFIGCFFASPASYVEFVHEGISSLQAKELRPYMLED